MIREGNVSRIRGVSMAARYWTIGKYVKGVKRRAGALLFGRAQYVAPNQAELNRWWADGGDYALRFNYDLSERSTVLDLGGYRGQWASDLYAQYRCPITVFEPVRSYAELIRDRFRKNHDISVNQYGLGSHTRFETMFICEDSSSRYRNGNVADTVEIKDVSEWLQASELSEIDLIKVNIEGGEYELLERLLEIDAVCRIKAIQVQFHDLFDGAADRMDAILEQLSKTHLPTYQYRFVWENWMRRA